MNTLVPVTELHQGCVGRQRLSSVQQLRYVDDDKRRRRLHDEVGSVDCVWKNEEVCQQKKCCR